MSLREKKSFFGKLSERLSDVINARSVVDEELFDELEEILITSDIGMDTTMRIIEELRGRVKDAHITWHQAPAGFLLQPPEILLK